MSPYKINLKKCFKKKKAVFDKSHLPLSVFMGKDYSISFIILKFNPH